MKVLAFAWIVYDDQIREFANNCTGGGLVIKNICEYIGRKEKSYLFIGKHQLPRMKLGNIDIVATDSIYLQEVNISSAELHIRTMCLNFRKALEDIKPDIVNFHGIGELMLRCMDICKQCQIPYVFTEHLYIGLHKDFEGYDSAVEWEKQLYSLLNVNIITVSEGMKKKILKDFQTIPEARIKTIVNGTDFCAEYKSSNIINTYNLKGKKVYLCVGTILARKNQLQIVRAFKLLPQEMQDKIAIVFCGNDSMNGELQQQISDSGLNDRLIYAGGVSSESMKKYYTISDGLLMPSKSEGLSIAALEAIAYGIPIVMYQDSECADDLNDEEVVCFVKERTDIAFMEAMIKLYNQIWNKEYIIRFSKKYTMEQMADAYIKYYQNIITNEIS